MLWYEDLTPGRIDRYGGYPVTREEVLAFARAYDPQPFHLDDEAAAANPLFGRLAASGWHSAAMTHRMTVDYWTAARRPILGGAGLEELSWLKPVFPGDTLRCESEVLEARPSASRPGVGIVKTRTLTLNQHDQPVLRLIGSVLIEMRP